MPPNGGAGAPEITPEMIDAGLEWLYAYNPDGSDGRETVRQIIKAALAIQSRQDVVQEQ